MTKIPLIRFFVQTLREQFFLLSEPKALALELFASMQSPGVVAIGHAEGNLTVTGNRTSFYWGHPDPADFVRNQGWCSDRGRGGGNPNLADQKCLERIQKRLPLILQDLKKSGLDPDYNLEVFVNTVDLYNQASPWVSRQFPYKYTIAKKQGKEEEQALVWARVEAFRHNGIIEAKGLIRICQQEKRPINDWDCVAQDQKRRVKAIRRVLENKLTALLSKNLFIFLAPGWINNT